MASVFTRENVHSYARGIVKLSRVLESLAMRAREKNREILIVIPSRGAYVPAMGSLYALGAIGKEEWHTQPEKLSKNFKTLSVNRARTKVLLIPLTADTGRGSIHMEYLEPHHLRAFDETEPLLRHIRRGGMHVLKVLLSEPEEREKDPAFKVFTRLLEIEGRKELANKYREFETRNPYVVLIDTAISGSAVSHILSGAKAEGVKLLPLIVADSEGRKLGRTEIQNIQKYLDWAAQGLIRVEQVLFPVRKLLVENRGAALQGLWAAIYPQVVGELFHRRIYGLGGTWHPLPKREEYQRTYSHFIDALAAAIDYVRGIRSDFSQEFKEFEDVYRQYRPVIVRHRVGSGKELVRDTGLPEQYYKRAAIKENNNRVVHIHFPKSTWRKKIKPLLF